MTFDHLEKWILTLVEDDENGKRAIACCWNIEQLEEVAIRIIKEKGVMNLRYLIATKFK
jgi:hypothetical protein